MFSYIAKSVFHDHAMSSNEACYMQHCVIMNRVIKRLMCISALKAPNTTIAKFINTVYPDKMAHFIELSHLDLQS